LTDAPYTVGIARQGRPAIRSIAVESRFVLRVDGSVGDLDERTAVCCWCGLPSGWSGFGQYLPFSCPA